MASSNHIPEHQHIVRGAEGGCVVAPLRLCDDEQATNELHGVVLEQTEVHEPLVLVPRKAAQGPWQPRHVRTLAPPRAPSNVDGGIQKLSAIGRTLGGIISWSTKASRGCSPWHSNGEDRLGALCHKRESFE